MRLIAITLTLVLAALLFAVPTNAVAASPTRCESPGSGETYSSLACEILEKMRSWNDEITNASTNALQSVQIVLFVKTEMFALAIFAAFLFLYKVGIREASLVEGVGVAMRMLLVSVAVLSYPLLTSTVAGIGTGVGEIMQGAMLGDSDALYPLFRLMSATENAQFTGVGAFWSESVTKLLGLVIAYASVAILIIVVALASIWSFWGYTLMKLAGIFFVPFLIHPATSKWFDNWLSIFLGFIAFELLARIAISFTTLAIFIALGIPPLGEPFQLTIEIMNFWSAIPLALFVAISVYGIFKTVSLSSALFGSGMGISHALGNVSSMVAKAFK